jgi:Protein of unknown function (DUF4197)
MLRLTLTGEPMQQSDAHPLAATRPLEQDSLEQTVALRRIILVALPLAALLAGPRHARGQGSADALLGALTQKDAAAGIRAALEKGAGFAVDLLGRADGFWGNERVRVPLPEWIQKAEGALKLFGRGKDVAALHLTINRAAEQAVPESKTLLVNAVRAMSVQDAKGILTGGNDSVTQFFAGKTRVPLTDRFLPVVARVTEKIGLARQYNRLAGQAKTLGLVKPEQATVQGHVTGRALDGLYLMIGEEEQKIRADPVAAGSDILRKVFGALK